MVALPFAGMPGIARRHTPACMPAIAMAWRGATKVEPSCQESGAGLMPGVRILQYVMQQAGNLLMLVTAEVGNKTGHGYLMAE